MNAKDWKFLLKHCSDSLSLAYLFSAKREPASAETAAEVSRDIEKIAGFAAVSPESVLRMTAERVIEILGD